MCDNILSVYIIQSLVSTHDRVANKEYPVVHSAAVDTTAAASVDDSVRIVRINKQREPLVQYTHCVKLLSVTTSE